MNNWQTWADSPQTEDIASHGNQWRLAGAAWEAATIAERNLIVDLITKMRETLSRELATESDREMSLMLQDKIDFAHKIEKAILATTEPQT